MIFHKRARKFTNAFFLSKRKNALLGITEVFEHDTRGERNR